MVWWHNREKKSREKLPILSGTRMAEVRDLYGWELGLIFNENGSEATMHLAITGAESWPANQIAEWEATLVGVDTLVATCVSRAVGAAETDMVASATFQTSSKKERRDSSEFMTRLARTAHVIYERADAAGLESTPMTAAQVSAWAQQALSPNREAEWPVIAHEIDESATEVTVDGVTHVVFELCVDDTECILDAVAAAEEVGIEGSGTVRIASWFRPALDPGGHSPGRRVLLVDISHPRDDLVEQAVLVWLSWMQPRTRLRARRLVHRQQVGMTASLGLGVLGWQHLEVVT